MVREIGTGNGDARQRDCGAQREASGGSEGKRAAIWRVRRGCDGTQQRYEAGSEPGARPVAGRVRPEEAESAAPKSRPAGGRANGWITPGRRQAATAVGRPGRARLRTSPACCRRRASFPRSTPRFNHLAKLAGMFAAERFLDRGADRFGLRVVDRHAHPRDGLQHGPVSAEQLHGGDQDEESGERAGQSGPWPNSSAAAAASFSSGERTRPACWRWCPRHRELGEACELRCACRQERASQEVRRGGTPRPGRETRALPGVKSARSP